MLFPDSPAPGEEREREEEESIRHHEVGLPWEGSSRSCQVVSSYGHSYVHSSGEEGLGMRPALPFLFGFPPLRESKREGGGGGFGRLTHENNTEKRRYIYFQPI